MLLIISLLCLHLKFYMDAVKKILHWRVYLQKTNWTIKTVHIKEVQSLRI